MCEVCQLLFMTSVDHRLLPAHKASLYLIVVAISRSHEFHYFTEKSGLATKPDQPAGSTG